MFGTYVCPSMSCHCSFFLDCSVRRTTPPPPFRPEPNITSRCPLSCTWWRSALQPDQSYNQSPVEKERRRSRCDNQALLQNGVCACVRTCTADVPLAVTSSTWRRRRRRRRAVIGYAVAPALRQPAPPPPVPGGRRRRPTTSSARRTPPAGRRRPAAASPPRRCTSDGARSASASAARCLLLPSIGAINVRKKAHSRTPCTPWWPACWRSANWTPLVNCSHCPTMTSSPTWYGIRLIYAFLAVLALFIDFFLLNFHEPELAGCKSRKGVHPAYFLLLVAVP